MEDVREVHEYWSSHDGVTTGSTPRSHLAQSQVSVAGEHWENISLIFKTISEPPQPWREEQSSTTVVTIMGPQQIR